MTDHTIDVLRQVCQEELDDKVSEITDGTEDIYEGRKEFAEQVLGLIEKLERPRQQDQYNKLQAKAIAATNARTELSEKVGSTWAPGALKE